MKRAIFIDRDGTLIVEPPVDFQVDSLEKLEFIPKVIRNLYAIRKNLDYELVIVSNQDGLGTGSYPESTFWPAHNKMLDTFRNEGISFDDILIDRSFPDENAPTRKPRTGMMSHYTGGDYDLAQCYVIGDRLTDLELALNLNSRAILFRNDMNREKLEQQGLAEVCDLITDDWDEIFSFLRSVHRRSTVRRTTRETDITVELQLDGSGKTSISTGLGFFDHMLDQIGRHSGCDLLIRVKGDLHVDEHHTVEDTALALGEAFNKALGDKRGIERYGFMLPMDDALATVAIDFGGRPWLVWNAAFNREKVGDVPTELFFHFFKSFSDAARCNLHIKAEGQIEHHKIEAIFKAFAKAIRMAVRRDADNSELPSTKGLL